MVSESFSRHSDVVSNITHHKPIQALAVFNGKIDEALIIFGNRVRVLLEKTEAVDDDFQSR